MAILLIAGGVITSLACIALAVWIGDGGIRPRAAAAARR